MKSLQSFVAQKISRRFILWFSITLSFPICGLLFFTISSLNDREELLRRQVQENQLGRVLQAEKLYLNNFYQGYVEAIQGLFVKVDRDVVGMVTRELDPKDSVSVEKFVKQYTDYFYREMLPYLGVGVDPLSSNREVLQRESFVILHLMEVFYADQELQDFYDALALSSINGHQESKYDGEAKLYSREMRNVYRSFNNTHKERKRWVSNRRFPSYRKYKPKDVLQGQTQVASKSIFKVFKKFPALIRLANDYQIRGEGLDELRESIAYLLNYRFRILDIVVELRRKFYQIKNKINALDKQTLKILGKERTEKISLESINDLEFFLKIVIEELESGRVKDSNVLLYLTTYKELSVMCESMLMSLASYKELIGKHFYVPEQLLNSNIDFNQIPENAVIESENFNSEKGEVSAELPLSYLKKLKLKGLKGKEWLHFAEASDIYTFPIRRVYELKDLLDKLSIKPSETTVTGYFALERLTAIQSWKNTTWQIVNKLLEHIIKFNLTGLFSINSADDAFVNALVSGADLAATRNRVTSLGAGSSGMSMIWEVVPRNFQLDEFMMGHSPLPEALMQGLIRDDGARLHFFRLWNAPIKIDHIAELDNILSSKLASLYDSVIPDDIREHIPGVEYENAGPEIKNLIKSVYKFKFSLNDETETIDLNFWDFCNHYLGVNKNYLVRRNRAWLNATNLQFLALRDPINEGEIPEELYIDSIMRSYLGEKSEVYEEFTDWLKNPVSPFLFEYLDNSNKRRIGSLVSSKELVDYVFLLSMDAETAYQENRYITFLLGFISIVTLLFGIGLGRLLANAVVTPVNKLSTKVSDFSEGNLTERIDISRGDEIGHMAFSFNEMVDNIESKIYEMQSVNSLNESLLKGDSPSTLMSYAVEQFCAATNSKIGYLGFFEQSSKEKLMGAATFGISESNLEDMELRLKVLVNKLNDDEFHFLPTYTAKNFGVENLFALKIRPQSEPLQEVSEVLGEISDHDKNTVKLQIEGFLFLGSYDHNLMGEEKLDFLHSFASQTGTVILKAYLDKVKKDNEEGQNIQEGLMPSEAPDTRGLLDISFSFVAAKYLGGDFYDFVDFEDSKYIGMMISDVSGKGIGPSLFGTTCQAYLSILATNPSETGETLKSMNERLCENKSNSLFATAFYLTINLDNLMMTYSSAGHNKMYLYRRRTNKIQYLSGRGLVLGMFSPCEYETQELQLEEGDWIILYTDGITELENSTLDLYGMQRFEELILENTDKSAEQMKEILLQDLELYRESVAPSDDITFILAKVNSKISNS